MFSSQRENGSVRLRKRVVEAPVSARRIGDDVHLLRAGAPMPTSHPRSGPLSGLKGRERVSSCVCVRAMEGGAGVEAREKSSHHPWLSLMDDWRSG